MEISHVSVSGLDESIHYSGLPMRIESEWLETPKDLERGTILANAPMGSGHDNFLNGIVVHFYVKATNKWWVEMQRYHFIDFVSSQSTMHRMKHFGLSDDEFIEHVDHRIIEILRELQGIAARTGSKSDELRLLYSVPSGFELGAYMVTNYRQLKTIYHQRKHHRLPEWREFCQFIEGLPHSEFITGGGYEQPDA